MPDAGLAFYRAKTALTEHAALLAAIRKRDPDAAEQAARRHVRAAQSERQKLLFPESVK